MRKTNDDVQLKIKNYSRALGHKIREERRARNIKTEVFRERLKNLGADFALSTITGWENGNRSVAVGILPFIASALETDIADLLPDTGETHGTAVQHG